jgi:hypothetical protein
LVDIPLCGLARGKMNVRDAKKNVIIVFGLRGTIIYNYLLFKNHIFLQHVSNFYSSSGNKREQKIILIEKVDTKTVVWQKWLSEVPN